MTEEIKEILGRLKYDKDDIYYIGFVDGINVDNTFLPKDIKLLLNYITNLQKDYERIYNENCKLREQHNINDISLLDKLQDYKQRNEKAVEYNKKIVEQYLKEDDCEYCDGRYNVAKKNLDILEGGDE